LLIFVTDTAMQIIGTEPTSPRVHPLLLHLSHFHRSSAAVVLIFFTMRILKDVRTHVLPVLMLPGLKCVKKTMQQSGAMLVQRVITTQIQNFIQHVCFVQDQSQHPFQVLLILLNAQVCYLFDSLHLYFF
jgi:hypothetical protein